METRRSRRNEQLVSQGGVPSMSSTLCWPKVLVAEDQPAMRQLLSSSLRAVGYDVIELPDGASLWSELRGVLDDLDSPRDPDLVISDIRMPGLDGLEVLARLRATDWATPVILITAFGTDETIREARRLGATLVLNKPFDIDDLIAAARSLVDPLPEAA